MASSAARGARLAVGGAGAAAAALLRGGGPRAYGRLRAARCPIAAAAVLLRGSLCANHEAQPGGRTGDSVLQATAGVYQRPDQHRLNVICHLRGARCPCCPSPDEVALQGSS